MVTGFEIDNQRIEQAKAHALKIIAEQLKALNTQLNNLIAVDETTDWKPALRVVRYPK